MSASTDIEDIISLLDGRSGLEEEVGQADGERVFVRVVCGRNGNPYGNCSCFSILGTGNNSAFFEKLS
ncbi:MAG: hypothetical protein SXA11_18130 [Cyanobacteriota bacterium]|nr:hypothetical protein [Cyanobacteriota bacterium]